MISRVRVVAALAGVALAVTALSGCSSTPAKGGAGSPSSGSLSSASSGVQTSAGAVDGAQSGHQGSAASGAPSPSSGASQGTTPAVEVSIADGSTKVRPDTPLTVTATGGAKLGGVTVTVTSGPARAVTGTVSADGTSWTTTDALAPNSGYRVEVKGTGPDGAALDRTSSFTTLSASTISTTLIPGDDWEVGVGMPVVVVFSRPVQNKDAALKALRVETSPSTVDGAWRWMSSTEVQWRPADYWPAGTKVLVTAGTSGAELAPGVWGRRTVTSSFTIGRKQISTVDVQAHSLTVERDDAVLRTIPVTTGKSGFLTRGGIKVIMDKQEQVRMDAATTGTDPKDPNYYNILVNWALRLTWSGEFLHAAPWSVGSQGRANVSHGCTGMSTANAKWLFDNSLIGDVVVYTGSSRALEWGNGYTAWNKSFSDWSSAA